MYIGSLIQYFLLCSIVEYHNPMPKTPKRMKNIYREIRYGAMVLSFGTLFTLLWVQYVEPFCPYHGYYNDKPYGVYEFLKGFIQHFLYTTIGAFITHRALHFPFLYKWIHSVINIIFKLFIILLKYYKLNFIVVFINDIILLQDNFYLLTNFCIFKHFNHFYTRLINLALL